MIEKIKKHFIKILIGAGIIGVVLAAGGGEVIPTVPSVDVNGTVIEFPYTDDNIGENLIIRSDKESYKRFLGGVIVYFSVENKSGAQQAADIRLYFSQDNRFLGKLYKLDKGVETICSSYSSTTDSWIEESCIKDEWTELPLLEIKTVKEKFKANKMSQLSISKDKTAYFKADVSYPANITDEFLIEAIGDNGGYGFLDPTILPDPEDFNAYDDGDLNGQGSWSGDVAFDVQGITVYEGAKAIKSTGTSDNIITKEGSLTSDGKVSWYTRFNANGYPGFQIREGANARIFVGARGSGFASYQQQAWYWNGSDSVVFASNLAENEWHLVEVEWRSSDWKARYQVDSQGWTVWDTNYGGWTSGVNTILLASSNQTGGEIFWDHIAEEPYSENEESTNNAIFFGIEF